MNQETQQGNTEQGQQNDESSKNGGGWTFTKAALLMAAVFLYWKSQQNREPEKPRTAVHQQATPPGQRVAYPPGTRPAPQTRPVTPTVPAPTAQQSVAKPAATKVEATVKFWNEVFVPLYGFAFVNPPMSSDSLESFDSNVQREVDQFAQRSRAAEYANADADLFEMAFTIIGAQRSIIAELVPLIETLEAHTGKKFDSSNAGDQKVAAQELVKSLQTYLVDPSSIPEEAHPLADSLIEFVGRNEEYVIQVLLMQIRMQERYHDQTFDLPPIEGVVWPQPIKPLGHSDIGTATTEATAALWEQVFLPLYRVVYVAPSDTWDEDRQRLDEIAVQARQTQYAEADADLIDLTLSHIARHRTHVDEVTSLDQLVQTQLGEQIAERAKEQQVDDATAYSESIDEFIAKFAADPAMIPEELHPLAQRLTDFYEDLPARHLEILAIQVRMQERYRNKSFELPKQ